MAKTKNTVYVVKLTIQGRPAYLPARPEWDRCWFTRELHLAKGYAREGNAERAILSYSWPADYAATTEPHARAEVAS